MMADRRVPAAWHSQLVVRPPAPNVACDLLLSKTPKGTILASESPGIRGMSADMGDTHAVGETATSKMGDIYAAVSESVTSKMGDIYAAVSETVTSKMGGTYAAAETHTVMGDG